jgi:hypothetical protein
LVKASSRLYVGTQVSFDTEYRETYVQLGKDAMFNLKVAQPVLPFSNLFLAECQLNGFTIFVIHPHKILLVFDNVFKVILAFLSCAGS